MIVKGCIRCSHHRTLRSKQRIPGPMSMNDENAIPDYINFTTEIVSAYVARNPVPAAELPALIGSVHAALQNVAQPAPLRPISGKIQMP